MLVQPENKFASAGAQQLTSQGHAEESCKSCRHAQQGAIAQPLPLILQHVPAVTCLPLPSVTGVCTAMLIGSEHDSS